MIYEFVIKKGGFISYFLYDLPGGESHCFSFFALIVSLLLSHHVTTEARSELISGVHS